MNRLNIALSATIDNEVISVNRKYLDAIVAAGGIANVLSPMIDDKYVSSMVDFFDGFMFCGGGDIDPKFYGEEKSEHIKNICLERDRFEKKLFHYAFASGKPVLGICRGMQIINVFLEGNLYQHIEGHMQKEDRNMQTHAVSVVKNSLLYEITGKDSLYVNSFHHQAVKKLADCLTVDAVSEDGYIEAFHHEKHRFLLGLQWHPESYFEFDASAAKVFRAFINSCK